MKRTNGGKHRYRLDNDQRLNYFFACFFFCLIVLFSSVRFFPSVYLLILFSFVYLFFLFSFVYLFVRFLSFICLLCFLLFICLFCFLSFICLLRFLLIICLFCLFVCFVFFCLSVCLFVFRGWEGTPSLPIGKITVYQAHAGTEESLSWVDALLCAIHATNINPPGLEFARRSPRRLSSTHLTGLGGHRVRGQVQWLSQK